MENVEYHTNGLPVRYILHEVNQNDSFNANLNTQQIDTIEITDDEHNGGIGDQWNDGKNTEYSEKNRTTRTEQ